MTQKILVLAATGAFYRQVPQFQINNVHAKLQNMVFSPNPVNNLIQTL
jgi:hypothetical protein